MWLTVVITLVCVIVAVSVRRRSSVEGPQPPEFPGAWPLIGHGHLFARGDSVALWELTKALSHFAASCGGVISFRPGLRSAYMVSDPDDCMTLANTALEKDFVYDFFKPIIGEGLFTAAVPTWRMHRKLLMPAFSQGVLDGFIGVFNSQAKRLVSSLDQESGKKPFAARTYVEPSALETICLTAMGGANADERLSDEYIHAFEELYSMGAQRLQKFWLHNNYVFYFSSLRKKVDINAKIINDLSNAVLQRKKSELRNSIAHGDDKSGKKFRSFIDVIIQYSGENGLLTDQEIREEVDTVIGAGYDTSASTNVYALILLGSHPEVQERVYNEIAEVLGDKDVEKQDLPKLVFLEAVLKETMRLYPIVPFIGRRLTQSVKLKNYTLPAGSAYLALCALNRHKMWGADAELFDPSRWLDKSRIPEHQAAFASFSLGRRKCIGKANALMLMKTTLAHLVRNFRFKSDISKMQLKLDLVLRPHSGHHISIEKRT